MKRYLITFLKGADVTYHRIEYAKNVSELFKILHKEGRINMVKNLEPTDIYEVFQNLDNQGNELFKILIKDVTETEVF